LLNRTSYASNNDKKLSRDVVEVVEGVMDFPRYGGQEVKPRYLLIILTV